MKVCIKTAGITARKLYRRLKQEKKITIVSFTDNDAEKWGQYIDDIPIESIFMSYEKYKSGEVDKLIIGTEMPVKKCRSIYKELIEIGFHKDDVLFLSIDYLKGDSKEYSFMLYEDFNYLQYIELHLTNHCNLNCAGCSHFVPLIPKEDEVDFGKLKKGLLRLKELVSHISVIRIMGGEPFLSPDLLECCTFIRHLYPYAYITVATNGSLIQKSMHKEMIQTLKEQDIVLDVTCYPVLYEKYDEIAGFLKKNQLKFHMDIRWGMCPVLHADTQHKFRLDSVELTCECVNLYKDKLYPCPLIAFISYFNKYYNQKYPEDEGVNIYKVTSFDNLYKELFKTKELCDYCNNYDMFQNYDRKKFKISGKTPDMNEWMKNYE